MQGLPAALYISTTVPSPSTQAFVPPSPPPLPTPRLQVVCVLLSVTSPLLKAVFSWAEAPNSWFRESHKVYWRVDLLSWDKTHSLAPQDGDVSVETITRPLNLHMTWGSVFQRQKDGQPGVFEVIKLCVNTRPLFHLKSFIVKWFQRLSFSNQKLHFPFLQCFSKYVWKCYQVYPSWNYLVFEIQCILFWSQLSQTLMGSFKEIVWHLHKHSYATDSKMIKCIPVQCYCILSHRRLFVFCRHNESNLHIFCHSLCFSFLQLWPRNAALEVFSLPLTQ